MEYGKNKKEFNFDMKHIYNALNREMVVQELNRFAKKNGIKDIPLAYNLREITVIS